MYYVYILSSVTKTLYIGVTNDIARRMQEHKEGLIPGFTQKYKVDRLVYLEQTEDVKAAITREKQFKNWRREKKEALINSANPSWNDLSEYL
jgi:putative endonuclease